MFIKKSECEHAIDSQHKKLLENLAAQFNIHAKKNGFGTFEYVREIKSLVPDIDKLIIKIRNELQECDWNMSSPYKKQEFRDGVGQLIIRFNYD